jgi:hypothetical protein
VPSQNYIKRLLDSSLCLRPHRTTSFPLEGFSWNLILVYFSKTVNKIQVPLNSVKNSRYITGRPMNISDHISLNSSYTEILFTPNCRENQDTYFVYNNVFRKSCHLWDNVEKYCTAGKAIDDNILQRMRVACRITKTNIDTHSEYVTLINFIRKK